MIIIWIRQREFPSELDIQWCFYDLTRCQQISWQRGIWGSLAEASNKGDNGKGLLRRSWFFLPAPHVQEQTDDDEDGRNQLAKIDAVGDGLRDVVVAEHHLDRLKAVQELEDAMEQQQSTNADAKQQFAEIFQHYAPHTR